MLPGSTPAVVRRALRGITEYDTFKHELRGEIRYPEDYGGMPTGSANSLSRESPIEREEREALQAIADSQDSPAMTVRDIPADIAPISTMSKTGICICYEHP